MPEQWHPSCSKVWTNPLPNDLFYQIVETNEQLQNRTWMIMLTKELNRIKYRILRDHLLWKLTRRRISKEHADYLGKGCKADKPGTHLGKRQFLRIFPQ